MVGAKQKVMKGKEGKRKGKENGGTGERGDEERRKGQEREEDWGLYVGMYPASLW